MSTVSQSAATATHAPAGNKRAAARQKGGAWKKRQVWQDRGEGSRTRQDREKAAGRAQQTAAELIDDSGSEAAGAGVSAASEKRLPKRKVALVFGYNGGGYAGLQIQTGSDKRTIEAEVADAILKAGGMLEANRQQLSKLNWQRCARTDKGVHAATNVLSLNLITQPDGLLQVRATLSSAVLCPVPVVAAR